ncbi:hypothetical protein LEP1GSC050_2247 [Leptospira broomii serovar Hurstbridge str. 5399]|uniref:Uncharacterized protein n=1 Tax=Leptospira broomii serovar Hurstbridge str. 5399 TaxID=1049789 RepID=T0GFQ5_9LEPT|nr:hypothetical protein LEP1GSC050_2247 [Leptospira broomii serovar Hurstbridge str. 5399]
MVRNQKRARILLGSLCFSKKRFFSFAENRKIGWISPIWRSKKIQVVL